MMLCHPRARTHSFKTCKLSATPNGTSATPPSFPATVSAPWYSTPASTAIGLITHQRREGASRCAASRDGYSASGSCGVPDMGPARPLASPPVPSHRVIDDVGIGATRPVAVVRDLDPGLDPTVMR